MSKLSLFSKNRSTDLTQGSIFSKLFLFALPLLAGQFFQALYNSVDSAVIGHFENTYALAAVTASSMISLIISGFFNGLSAGASAVFAREFGAKEYDTLHDSVHTTVLFGIFLGVGLAAAGIILAPWLLNITNCPAEIFSLALKYLRIYLIGVLFTSIYNVGAAVLRSVGDSRSPFIFLVISSLTNIVLDLIFVVWFGMGVSGVAIATVISQLISVILVFYKMISMNAVYRFRFSEMKINPRLLAEVCRMGLPAAIQSSVHAIGNLFTQSYMNSFSDATIAGIGSAMKIDQFICMPCNTFGLAMTTFIGQNLGAKKYSRTHKSVGIAALSVVIYVIVLSIPAYIFAPTLMKIFSLDPEVIQYGTGMLRTILPAYTLMGLQMLFAGIARGYRYSISSMVLLLIGFVGGRQVWLYFTLNYIAHDVKYFYLCYPVSWALALIGTLSIYLFFARKKYPSSEGLPDLPVNNLPTNS